MSKTNEFRINESEGVFSVQRKLKHNKAIHYRDFYTKYDMSFIINPDAIDTIRLFDYKLKEFPSLESAKQFITDELKAEEEPIEGVVYHSYP